jgi:hypothetical protein
MIAFRSGVADHRRLGPMTDAVRNELDVLRLRAFVAELEAQIGSVDETEVARYSAMLAAVSAATELPRSTA